MRPWIHDGEALTEVPEGMVGFVYRIARIRDGKSYIGKKVFVEKVTKPPLKGKLRKRRSTRESNWPVYHGSCDELAHDIAQEGQDAFSRTITHLCSSKAEMAYFETREIMVHDAILRDDFYNAWVSATLRRSHFPS